MDATCRKLLRTVGSRAGFTLIEMLIVIIILGILAMVIIPQINVSQDDAKVSAAKANLATLRSAIGLYYTQHNNTYPNANIITQMTQFTTLTGVESGSANATATFGPYLKDGIPANPFSTANANLVNVSNNTGNVAAPRTVAGTEGWQYWSTVGIIFLNDGGSGHNTY